MMMCISISEFKFNFNLTFLCIYCDHLSYEELGASTKLRLVIPHLLIPPYRSAKFDVAFLHLFLFGKQLNLALTSLDMVCSDLTFRLR